ncbi:MAG: Glycogen operon protein GlgX [Chlamydiales bacterium]|nr:Glycogen operon protein GlgX [Chlamydiales bacterium]
MKENFENSRGFPNPFGTSKHPKGINFALFSKHATHVSLCLFKPGRSTPCCEIPLDPKINKSGYVWHVFVYALPSNYEYGYRVDGPYDPPQGHYFDNRITLLDPYAKKIASPSDWGSSAPIDLSPVHKGIVYPLEPFHWETDTHPNIPLKELIIYEMHVRGFTQDPSSKVKNRGTFLGMIEKIPYLKSLGVNAVELLPLYEFNEKNNPFTNPDSGEPLYNYWGYSTINFFSPMNRYGVKNSINEFKQLVKALHAEGIEVILDVVYNHTAEGNEEGPAQSFKGLENSTYYMLAPNGEYYNFSGCGNTVNCNHPVVRDFIRDSLRYWVTEMHVDGFRFDLASILVRSQDGVPLKNPPLIEAISLDPILANTKLIAEAWDAGGLYQVGSFPGLGIWAEWNGKYRDEVRQFIKGTDGSVGDFASRLSGSEDLYGERSLPSNSINFITSHDGFSLADLVSYNDKHNLSNGEENRDGDNNNESWNCGEEGLSDNPHVLALRERQRKNFHVALMVSQGVPMLLMGDEYGHSKLGNNNTWGHDSRLNWFQWDTLEEQADFFRFYTKMIQFRKNHPVLTRSRFLGPKDVTWHGVETGNPDWSEHCRLIAFSLPDTLDHSTLYIAFNASFKELTIQLPNHKSGWYRYVDTSKPSPKDIVDKQKAKRVQTEKIKIASHSAIILISESLPHPH